MSICSPRMFSPSLKPECGLAHSLMRHPPSQTQTCHHSVGYRGLSVTNFMSRTISSGMEWRKHKHSAIRLHDRVCCGGKQSCLSVFDGSPPSWYSYQRHARGHEVLTTGKPPSETITLSTWKNKNRKHVYSLSNSGSHHVSLGELIKVLWRLSESDIWACLGHKCSSNWLKSRFPL